MTMHFLPYLAMAVCLWCPISLLLECLLFTADQGPYIYINNDSNMIILKR